MYFLEKIFFGIIFFIAAFSARAAMSEFDDCRVPEKIVFQRGQSSMVGYVNYRYVKYHGEILKMMDFKNPEIASANGPGHYQNCTTGSNPNVTQRIRFTLITNNFFTYFANHLAVLLRANFLRSYGVNGGSQVGRGLAIFPNNPGSFHSGIIFENFSDGTLWSNGTPPSLYDNTLYHIELRASQDWVRVIVWDEHGNLIQDDASADPVNSNISTTGFGVGLLCNDPSVSCDYPYGHPNASRNYEVVMDAITMDWLPDSQFGY